MPSDAGRTLLYLSRRDVESLGLGFAEIVDRLTFGFTELAAGRAMMPAKVWIVRDPETFHSAMPCYIPALGLAGCKWSSGNPKAAGRGLPYIQSLYLLTDGETGAPLALMDSTWITAMRTGAASALTIRHLVRPGAQAAGILGCGVQGRSHLRALAECVPGIEAARVFDVNPAAAERFTAEMSAQLRLDVRAARSAREALDGADVIVVAGSNERPRDGLIAPDWIAPGAVAVSVNRDTFWTAEAIAAMDRIVTDDRRSIAHMQEHGIFTLVSRVDAELPAIVAGTDPGRTAPGQRIAAFNPGVALEDLVTAAELYRRALDRGVGTRLPL